MNNDDFFFFWLCWVFVAVRALSLVVEGRDYSWLWYLGFSLWWFLLLLSTGSRVHLGSAVAAVGFSCPDACGIFHRDQTHVPCIGRQLLNHYTTR